MHVKALFFLGAISANDSSLNNYGLRRNFIGVYDGTAWPPTTVPKICRGGTGNNRDGYGKDFLVDAWGNYVVLWGTYKNNNFA